MQTNSTRIVIVGAGPSGLSFALACAAQGISVRILEKRTERHGMGKATGLSHGVIQLLRQLGVAEAVLTHANPMRNFVFFDDNKLIANVAVPLIEGHPPAYLYPQNNLELLLERALLAFGVKVEYGCTVKAIEQTPNSARIAVQHLGCDTEESIEADWLIGADGAHSTVQQMMGFSFTGRDYPEQWSVAQITTQQWPGSTNAQLFLQPNGVGLFLSQPSQGLVQGILNAPGVARLLSDRFADAEVQYEREFQVSLRRVATPRKERVWLIGDAAHVQSPVGGQGLNLAIWDGITLANALIAGDMGIEKRLIRRAQKVLAFTDFDYRMLASTSPTIRALRNGYWRVASKWPRIATWFFKIIAGVS